MILKLWPSNGNKIKMSMYKLWKGNRKKKNFMDTDSDC